VNQIIALMAINAMAEFVLRTVGQFVLEVVIVGVFYWPGWIILRVVTLGRYPPERSEPHNRKFVAAVGVASLLAGLTLFYSVAF
jgi:hypothetical protein